MFSSLYITWELWWILCIVFGNIQFHSKFKSKCSLFKNSFDNSDCVASSDAMSNEMENVKEAVIAKIYTRMWECMLNKESNFWKLLISIWSQDSVPNGDLSLYICQHARYRSAFKLSTSTLNLNLKSHTIYINKFRLTLTHFNWDSL